jgi:glycosyltransferase involved in cell wall biosynthesis
MTIGILFVENYIAGGADRVANILIKQLPFSQLILMVNPENDMRILLKGDLPRHLIIKKYGLVTIPTIFLKARQSSSLMIRSLAKGLGILLRYPLFLVSIPYFMYLIRQTGASLVLVNNGGYPGGYYCRSASIAAGFLPSVRTYHLVHSMATSRSKPFFLPEFFIDRCIDRCNHLITICKVAAIQLNVRRGVRQKVDVIYNGIEDIPTEHLSENYADTLKIINVGYFDHNKNQEMLLRAVAELSLRGKNNIEVIFIGENTGDGSFERCKQLTLELSLEATIQYVGFISDIVPFYESSSVFVLCSYHEGMPMSILEAMRAGRAVIATNVGGVSEMVSDGVNGFLVPPGDYLSLADKLETLIIHRDLLSRFGSASRRLYETNFSMDKMISGFIKTLGLNKDMLS